MGIFGVGSSEFPYFNSIVDNKNMFIFLVTQENENVINLIANYIPGINVWKSDNGEWMVNEWWTNFWNYKYLFIILYFLFYFMSMEHIGYCDNK